MKKKQGFVKFDPSLKDIGENSLRSRSSVKGETSTPKMPSFSEQTDRTDSIERKRINCRVVNKKGDHDNIDSQRNNQKATADTLDPIVKPSCNTNSRIRASKASSTLEKSGAKSNKPNMKTPNRQNRDAEEEEPIEDTLYSRQIHQRTLVQKNKKGKMKSVVEEYSQSEVEQPVPYTRTTRNRNQTIEQALDHGASSSLMRAKQKKNMVIAPPAEFRPKNQKASKRQEGYKVTDDDDDLEEISVNEKFNEFLTRGNGDRTQNSKPAGTNKNNQSSSKVKEKEQSRALRKGESESSRSQDSADKQKSIGASSRNRMETLFEEDRRRMNEMDESKQFEIPQAPASKQKTTFERNPKKKQSTLQVSSMPIEIPSSNEDNSVAKKKGKQLSRRACSENSDSVDSQRGAKPRKKVEEPTYKKQQPRDQKSTKASGRGSKFDVPKVAKDQTYTIGDIYIEEEQQKSTAISHCQAANGTAKQPESSAQPSVEEIPAIASLKQAVQSQPVEKEIIVIESSASKPVAKLDNKGTAIKRPMRPNIPPPKPNLKRKRPNSDSQSFDNYGEVARSSASESFETPPPVQKKTKKAAQRNDKRIQQDSDDSAEAGKAPRKKQKKDNKKPMKREESFSSEEIFQELEESRVEAVKAAEKSNQKKAAKEQPYDLESEVSEKQKTKKSALPQPLLEAAPPLVFSSLKERLAALQAQLKKTERPANSQPLTRVEPVMRTNDQTSLAQSRISQLINSTVSNPGISKSIVSQIFENVRANNLSQTPPLTCIPQSTAPVEKKKVAFKEPSPMEMEGEPQRQPEAADNSVVCVQEEFPRPPPVADQSLLSSNVRKFMGAAEREIAAGKVNIPPASPNGSIPLSLQTKINRIEQQAQIIQSRVVEPSVSPSIPQTLTTSRIELMYQQRRRLNLPSRAELPGLLLQQQASPLNTSTRTQSTLNAPNRLPPPATAMTQLTQPTQPTQLQQLSSASDKPIESPFTKICNLLTSENYESLIEVSGIKDANSMPPSLVVTVSPKQRQNYARYKDLLQFQLFGQPYYRVRLGVFSVFDSSRRPLPAGYVMLFSYEQPPFEKIFDCFFNIHRAEPESILTNRTNEIRDEMARLKAQHIFNGTHLYSPKEILRILEDKVFKTWLTNDRGSNTEPIQRFITERSRERTDQCEKLIRELAINIKTGKGESPELQSILNEKHKICYSYLPPSFCGIGMNLTQEYISQINNCFRHHQFSNDENLVRELIKLESKLMPKEANNKLVVYADAIEEVFQDERLGRVRQTLDYIVFRTFLKSYTEAFFNIVVEGSDERALKIGNFDCFDRRTNERLKIAGWQCPCKDEKKTGLPCMHTLAGARLIGGLDYLELVRPRWRHHSTLPRVLSDAVDKAEKAINPKNPPANQFADKVVTSNTAAFSAKPIANIKKIKAERGILMDFENIDINSDEENDKHV